jgi:YfiH family protein
MTTSTSPTSSSSGAAAPVPELLTVDLGAGATAAFTTRAGGGSQPPYEGWNLADHVGDDPSAVAANRAVLAAALGVATVGYPDQVHSALVLPVESGTGASCDGLVGGTPGAFGVLAADCVPVVLADAPAGVGAALHAGRRGLAAGVVANGVAALVARGADPSRTVAAIGPAICGRCYEVSPELRAEVAAVLPATSCTTDRGTPGLDLPAGVAAVLAAAGVRTVIDLGLCTREDPRFYSYRRDGRTGRHAGVLVLG